MMVEVKNVAATLPEMACGLVREFRALQGDRDLYERYMARCTWTPHDGITMRRLHNLDRDLAKKEVLAKAVPSLVVDKDRMKMVVGTDVHMVQIKEMAELLVFMQASKFRMMSNQPLYEVLKALVWYTNSLFRETEPLNPVFDEKVVSDHFDELPFEVDDSMMPIICSQYMSSVEMRGKLQTLIEQGMERDKRLDREFNPIFTLDDPDSFYKWLMADDDYHPYARKRILKDLEGVKAAMRSSMQEMMMNSFVLAKQGDDDAPVDSTTRVHEEIMGTLEAVMKKTSTPIEPVRIVSVGTHLLTKKRSE